MGFKINKKIIRLVLKSKSILLIVLFISISLNIVFVQNSKNYKDSVLSLNKKTEKIIAEYKKENESQKSFYINKIKMEKEKSLCILSENDKLIDKVNLLRDGREKKGTPTTEKKILLNNVIAQNFKLKFNLKETLKTKEIDIKEILKNCESETQIIISKMESNCKDSLKSLEIHHKKNKIKNYIIGGAVGAVSVFALTVILKSK